jgi:hypothetical protein
MKQHEAVIHTMERLGGMATLGQLYQEVLKEKACTWKTKTPFASIRRIVQLRPEVFKIKPGLYGLVSQRKRLAQEGYSAASVDRSLSTTELVLDHSYFQGLLLQLGRLRNLDCWAPHQDKNRRFLNSTIGATRTLSSMPPYSYPRLVKRSETVDVIWFNERKMPHSFFEVEHSTDIQNSLLKFNDLRDFNARLLIVSNVKRRREYEAKLEYNAFSEIAPRVKFLSYDWLIKEYEHEMERRAVGVAL